MKGVCTINIDDVTKRIKVPKGPILITIFNHQKELMKKYDEIETSNGYEIPKPPYSIEDTKVQQRIKDMFWRMTEELSEAVETFPGQIELLNWKEYWATSTDIRHFFEELADALHFLVEASIIARVNPYTIQLKFSSELNNIPPSGFSPYEIREAVIVKISDTIFHMGYAANTLKNKPWKLTQMSTDITKFKKQLIQAWEMFILMWRYLSCDEKQIYLFYIKKNLVNKWRQETNY